MNRLTSNKKDNHYSIIRTNSVKDIIEFSDKLGQLEDILEKFGIDDLQTLEEILKVHKFLLDHDYSTLPKEDFDLLFNKIKALDIIKKKRVDIQLLDRGYITCVFDYNNQFDDKKYHLTQEEYDLLKEMLL